MPAQFPTTSNRAGQARRRSIRPTTCWAVQQGGDHAIDTPQSAIWHFGWHCIGCAQDPRYLQGPRPRSSFAAALLHPTRRLSPDQQRHLAPAPLPCRAHQGQIADSGPKDKTGGPAADLRTWQVPTAPCSSNQGNRPDRALQTCAHVAGRPVLRGSFGIRAPQCAGAPKCQRAPRTEANARLRSGLRPHLAGARTGGHVPLRRRSGVESAMSR